MWALRVTVTHSRLMVATTGTYKSNYIVLVDTPNMSEAYNVALDAMKEKYRNLYTSDQFDIASGAQPVDGHLDSDQVYKILFTN